MHHHIEHSTAWWWGGICLNCKTGKNLKDFIKWMEKRRKKGKKEKRKKKGRKKEEKREKIYENRGKSTYSREKLSESDIDFEKKLFLYKSTRVAVPEMGDLL